jgi:glycosyltransferase involved in cell wall biosynthesis
MHLNLAHATTFHGFLTQRQLRPIVERAHVNVVSSLHEAGPLVVLESAVVGVPTVGTAVGHVAEWAPDAALAVPVGDAAALAAAIARLIADEDLRLRLAAEASRRALTQDADHTAALFEALYADLTAAAASRHGG